MRNTLLDYGYTEQQIDEKINACFHDMFENEKTKIYFESEPDAGYMCDTGNNDARTEGMSYGMMMAVQMGRKDIFDKLWTWSLRYMYQKEGWNKGYFAWSCATDGTKNAEGPAPDGEEYFAMALFFAAHRFGDGEAPYNYSEQARAILHDCLHKGENGTEGHAMWDKDNKYILFVPGCPFSDPSYHLPHFYELFALWANEEDRQFWREAAEASREYLHKACHVKTGLAPDYGHFNGFPVAPMGFNKLCYTHYSDSYRVAMNIGLDALWYGKDKEWQEQEAEKLQQFYKNNPAALDGNVFMVDGTPISEPVRHPVAITSTAAAISAALPKNELSEYFINKFMNTPMRTDNIRYYDNCLYFFSLLLLSGKYEIFDK